MTLRSEAHANLGNLEVRRHEGREAVREIAASLTAAGFLPAPVPGMDPEYLAEGFEGDHPGAMIACRGGRPVAYMTYALAHAVFRPALGALRVARFPYRQLRLFGYASQVNDHRPILARFFTSLFEDRTWHIGQILDLPANHPLCEFAVHASLENGRSYSAAGKAFDTIQVKLDENFDSYLKNQFTKKSRYNIKREVRLLEAAAPDRVAVKVYSSAEEAVEFLRLAAGIAKLTYQRKLGLSTIEATPFVVRKASYLARRGALRSYILFIRDVPAAYCYATFREGKLSYDNIGYDPRFAELNPGKVLLYRILEELHESRVVPQLEFGRGLADYKLLFANSRRRVLDVNLYPYEPYPQALRFVDRAADFGYQSLRPLVQPLMPYIKRSFQLFPK